MLSVCNHTVETEYIPEFIFSKRSDARSVLLRMRKILKQCGKVTIADLHSLVGVLSTYIDEQYGWTDLDWSKIDQVHGGYIIRLPKEKSVDLYFERRNK